jgi:hypothetical protein
MQTAVPLDLRRKTSPGFKRPLQSALTVSTRQVYCTRARGRSRTAPVTWPIHAGPCACGEIPDLLASIDRPKSIVNSFRSSGTFAVDLKQHVATQSSTLHQRTRSALEPPRPSPHECDASKGDGTGGRNAAYVTVLADEMQRTLRYWRTKCSVRYGTGGRNAAYVDRSKKRSILAPQVVV